MRLKKERWLVEEQMRHVQEKRKTSTKEEQKCLPEERCEQVQTRSEAQYAAAQSVVVEKEREEISVDVIKDKSEMGKFASKLTNFIKRDGTVKIRRSSRENRMMMKRVRFKLRTHDNIYRDGKVWGETRPLDFKIVDPGWMKKGVVRKSRKNEIEFEKRCF
ncbi:uncharacterized protein TNCV_1534121 [Trichonephila clavipes]|nr:uncharacterized protein TNCV_1534121 [Trichonephila clavipes]